MRTFKYVTILLYGVHLNYEQIHEIFVFCSYKADQATDGDRSLWCLHMSNNVILICFMHKYDWNLFQDHAAIVPALASASTTAVRQNSCAVCPVRLGEQVGEKFEFIHRLSYDYVEPEQVGEYGAAASEIADSLTEDDRPSYGVWFYNNEIYVGFENEDDRDVFAQIGDDEIAAEEDMFYESIPLTDTQRQAITAH
ncbi:hypothetical protein ACRAWG_09785 [Methylobacterium sp. P31]